MDASFTFPPSRDFQCSEVRTCAFILDTNYFSLKCGRIHWCQAWRDWMYYGRFHQLIIKFSHLHRRVCLQISGAATEATVEETEWIEWNGKVRILRVAIIIKPASRLSCKKCDKNYKHHQCALPRSIGGQGFFSEWENIASSDTLLKWCFMAPGWK